MAEKPTYDELRQRVKELEKEAIERRRAEEALRESEIEISAIMDNAPLIMMLVDKDRRVRKASGALIQFADRAEKHLIGKCGGEALRCIYHQDDPRGCGFGPACEPCPVRRVALDTFRTGDSYRKVEAKLSFEGDEVEERTLLVSTTLLDLTEKKVLVCIEDITGRKRAEEALQKAHDELEQLVEVRTTELKTVNEQLKGEIEEHKRIEEMLRESEGNYRLVVENVPAMIAYCDKAKRYRFVNKKYASNFGLEPEQLVGKHPLEILGKDIYAVASPHIEKVLSGEPVSWEHIARFKDGRKRWLSVAYVPHYIDGTKTDGFYALIVDIDDRKRAEEKLQHAFSEIELLKDRLQSENIYLREEIVLKYKYEAIIGQSDAIKEVLVQCEQVADTDSTVLMLGETGTGKELMARTIHNLSSRKDRPMITLNCAALPATLIESEIFGREKGAYTGALTRQIGRFEVADGSTIFLDEISELPLELQAKLLRVLQDGEFERLGSPETIKVDVRVIAATNRDLAKDVRKNRFREDLYYRINVFPITVPPLRDRKEDIPRLAWAFIREFEKTMGKRIETIPRKTIEILQHYPWPGNVRELRNVIERAMIISKGNALNVEMPAFKESDRLSDATLKDVEKSHIIQVLKKAGWRVKGKNGAAEILGLKPTTLHSRMKKLGIKRPPK